MRFTILIGALLFAAVNAHAVDTDRDILAMKAAKVASKNKLCVCDASQFYGRIGRLQVQTASIPSASCAVPFFDAFGKTNGGVSCALFTVLP